MALDFIKIALDSSSGALILRYIFFKKSNYFCDKLVFFKELDLNVSRSLINSKRIRKKVEKVEKFNKSYKDKSICSLKFIQNEQKLSK